MVVLTLGLLMTRTKNTAFRDVTQINMCASGLTDISLISELNNLQILSMSVNKIDTLRPLAGLTQLEQLYLRQNNIADLAELRYLSGLRKLTILSLQQNPISSHANYRKVVFMNCLSLKNLDGTALSANMIATELSDVPDENFEDASDSDDSVNVKVEHTEEKPYIPKKIVRTTTTGKTANTDISPSTSSLKLKKPAIDNAPKKLNSPPADDKRQPACKEQSQSQYGSDRGETIQQYGVVANQKPENTNANSNQPKDYVCNCSRVESMCDGEYKGISSANGITRDASARLLESVLSIMRLLHSDHIRIVKQEACMHLNGKNQ